MTLIVLGKKIKDKILGWLLKPIVNRVYLLAMKNYYCHGNNKKLHLGKNVSALNAIFNVSSGHIYIGDYTIFGHNCMIITGRHEFLNGKRKKLVTGGPEAPTSGYDIVIGKGCWIASGAIISGGVTIGDNVIIGAGSVVTKDVPSGVFAAGIPARIIRNS